VAVIIAIALLALALPVHAATPAAQRPGADGWAAKQIRKGGIPKRDEKLVGRLPGRARLGYHPETRRVRFISGTPEVPLGRAVSGVASGERRLSAADARSSARRFMDRYGQLFGLKAPAQELRIRQTRRRLPVQAEHFSNASEQVGAGLPNATVRFEQVRDGVPVLGGEIVVQLSTAGEVLSAAGEVLPSGARATTRARVPAARARRAASTWLAREAGRPESAAATRSEGLGLYDARIMDDPFFAARGARLVWQIDTRLPATSSKPAQHRLVLVDALGGGVLHSISRVHTADRRVCDNRNVPGKAWLCASPFKRTEGQPATGIGDVDTLYRLMGVTYDYFFDRFGRDGVDGKGARMKATVRYCASSGCPWNNAEWKWSQQQAIFGKGWARADDVVAHEFTHGVLDHEAPLFYHYQSGAINESIADIFGELIDLSYSGGKDTSWTRWKIGEDTPVGIFRDMKHPPRFGHPDRVRSPKWHKGSSDDGGVHRNSGVGNKAAYLMADGGSFRGYTVKPIGRTRTARVWYQALTTRLTSAANYIDLGDALNSACTDLAGSNGMTFAHCKSVRDAVKATQMAVKPKTWAPKTAPVCSAGKSPVYVLSDDLEQPGSGAWAATTLVGSKKGWFYPQNPNDIPAWDGSWSSSGVTNFYAPDRGSRSDATMRLKVPVPLPPKAYLRFEHGFSFDKDAKRRYDGGLVEIKIGDDPWRGVGQHFTHGGYNGTLAKRFGNPLGGRRAFTGNSHGWAEARVDLSPFAGESIKLRFRAASDRAVGARGWYIDDIAIYACAKDDDQPTGSLTINGGDATTSDADVAVSLSFGDATTWVTKLRISGSGAMNEAGTQLRKGLTMPVHEMLTWDLADTTYGGSGGPGTRKVFAQVRDAVGNWSSVFSDEIELIP